MTEPFTFGIPLIAKAASRDWPLVEALLELTLASVRGQTDQDFDVIIAGHDKPCLSNECDFHFIKADWAAEAVRADNLDSGRKKTAIGRHVARDGGGLLMFLDGDDWVDNRLVETARRTILDHQVGGIIRTGHAIDIGHLNSAPIPGPLFDRDFNRLCGSSIVARLDASASRAIRRDPFEVMHEHHRWIEACREHKVEWQDLECVGCYSVNTSVNHSEEYGPFAQWRRDFARGVACDGKPIDSDFLAAFGLSLEHIRAMRDRVSASDKLVSCKEKIFVQRPEAVLSSSQSAMKLKRVME